MALPASVSAEQGAQTYIATATGSGTFMGRAVVVLRRGQPGQCALQEEPLFFSAVVKNTGQVTVPNRTAA